MILATSSSVTLIIWIVLIFVMLYFSMIRPQNKERKRKEAMLAAMEIGDTVLTSSGFYGTLIDVQADMVIVEFGSNRNCRIPMQREAIVDVERPADSLPKKQEAVKTEEKKSWSEKRAEKKAEKEKDSSGK